MHSPEQDERNRGTTRRSFLKGAGVITLSLSLGTLRLRAPLARTARADTVSYQNYQDLYRAKWKWDRVAKGTHYVNCAYQRGCAWNVYVKEGVVWREEQVGSYPQTNSSVPDFNPRGCQKGGSYSLRMVDPSRVHYPLKRVGARGEGKWKRISWDEALREIADKSIDALTTDGPGSIYWDMGSAVTNGCHGLGLTRTVSVLDTPMFEANTEIGDHFPGSSVTLGKICYTNSYDDLFYSDLILIWGGNPTYTQIPNAHFINEARYHGARVVTITPDFNASAVHSDTWIPVAPGSDAAFGLAMAHVMIEEGLYDETFVKEQSDLPFLVRTDTSLFLRESDMEKGGTEEIFYIFDQRSKRVRKAPNKSLALNGLDPALEGEFSVQTLEGTVTVTTVFHMLRKQLADYTPENTEKITGTKPALVRHLARAIAKAKAASSITQTNFSKYYHGLEMERAQILVFTLAGQIGKKGAGIAAFPYMSISGHDALSMARGSLPPKLALAALGLEMAPEIIKMKLKGYTNQLILFEMGQREYRHGRYLATPLFLYQYAGLKELYGSAKQVDPWMKREFKDYFDESVEKGWQIVSKTEPRILFEVGGNMFRRIRGYDRMFDGLLPKLDLLVTVDWRMSNTARYSDYVLPAAGWYEKDDITWGSPITPFSHVTTRAVQPLAEAKTDWQFHCLYLKTLQERAKQRGLQTYSDRAGKSRRLDQVYDEFTFGGRYTEDNTEDFLQVMLEVTSNLGGTSWQELKENGYARYTGLGMSANQIGHATDFVPGETITANTWHTQKKEPWPTVTRRMQFYIDHPLFMELNEQLPIHKDNPAMGGNYPLQMTGGHARWSIHSSWRDEKHLLNLQRGEPVIFLGVEDATAREIQDGDKVRVFNDFGAFEIQAKITPTVRPGQVFAYHAWEPYQFKGEKTHQSLIPSPMNPIHLAGGYFQLQANVLQGEPGSPDRGTRVEIERIS